MVSKILFFATASDVKPILGAIDEAVGATYVRMGNFLSKKIDKFVGAGAIPNLGIADASSSTASTAYLVIPQKIPLIIREVNGYEGVRYLVDQLQNPATIEFSSGGYFEGRALLHGRFATVSNDPESQKLMRIASGAVRRNFRKVKSYYVGAEAYSNLENGLRLTMSVSASPDYDLAIG